jgi:hypothetical protein
MFCAQCTLLDIHRDFAGPPAWLRHEGTVSEPVSSSDAAAAVRRERFVCPLRGCGARWLRVSDPAVPAKRRWEPLLA